MATTTQFIGTPRKVHTMSFPRFTLWPVAVLAIVLIAAQAAAQGQPKLPKEKISSAGEIKAIQQGVFQVKNIGGDEWFIRVEAMPKEIFMRGEAEGSWLRVGMPVEFSGMFLVNKKGQPLERAQEPITEVKIVSSREDPRTQANAPAAPAPVGVSKEPARGSFLVGTKPKEEKPENTAPYAVKGILRSYKGARMTVATGQATFTADLAPDAKISVNISDLHFARVGDELEFEGWYIPGQKKYVHATSVWITATTTLSGDKKTGRRVASNAKPAPRKTTSSAPMADQRRAITQVSKEIASAARLYDEKSLAEAADAVKGIQKKIGKLSGNPTAVRLLKTPYARLASLHALLEMDGFKMPPLKEPKLTSK